MIIEGILVIEGDFNFRSDYLMGVWLDTDSLANMVREEKRLRPGKKLRILINHKGAYGLFSEDRVPQQTLYDSIDFANDPDWIDASAPDKGK